MHGFSVRVRHGGWCGITCPDNVVCSVRLQTRLVTVLYIHGIRHPSDSIWK